MSDDPIPLKSTERLGNTKLVSGHTWYGTHDPDFNDSWRDTSWRTVFIKEDDVRMDYVLEYRSGGDSDSGWYLYTHKSSDEAGPFGVPLGKKLRDAMEAFSEMVPDEFWRREDT